LAKERYFLLVKESNVFPHLYAAKPHAAAAATAAIAAAAEQNHEQNDNPAASTIIFETHNTRLLCVSFI